MQAEEVAQLVEDYAPRESGMAGDELGLLAGEPEREVAGVVTCWSPTLAVLRQAAELGANLVITHEPLTWRVCGRDPEAGLTWYEEDHPTAKRPNQQRMAVVLEEGLTVYRYHSNWDWAPRYGMVDMLVAALELGEHLGGERVAPVYAVAPTPLGQLAADAARRLGAGPLRVVGDLERVIEQVAICHGGFGQMFTFPEVAVRGGAQAAFFGEMLDYTMRYAAELGLGAIELGHYRSENPGMVGMAQFLRARLPAEIPVRCLPTGEAWTMVNGS